MISTESKSIVLIVLETMFSHPTVALSVVFIFSWTWLAIKRLYLSPIAHIPGPKLAALTQWYESYYDIWLGGQYTFRILEMHREYGPIVRISPWEVHIGDPEFFSELYTGPSRRREKWAFYTKQASMPRAK